MTEPCEVCSGRHGDAIGEITFGAAGETVTWHTCRACFTAVVETLNNQFAGAIDADNAEVAHVRRLFGLDPVPDG